MQCSLNPLLQSHIPFSWLTFSYGGSCWEREHALVAALYIPLPVSCFPSTLIPESSIFLYFPLIVRQESYFQDRDAQFFRFVALEPSSEVQDSEELLEALALLTQLGPTALLTSVLRKPWVRGLSSGLGRQVGNNRETCLKSLLGWGEAGLCLFCTSRKMI